MWTQCSEPFQIMYMASPSKRWILSDLLYQTFQPCFIILLENLHISLYEVFTVGKHRVNDVLDTGLIVLLESLAAESTIALSIRLGFMFIEFWSLGNLHFRHMKVDDQQRAQFFSLNISQTELKLKITHVS